MTYILHRLVTQLFPVMLIASMLVFLVVRVIPGDPAAAAVGENATAEAYAQARERLGLDEPIPTQYVTWITSAFRGDFGQSIKGPQASEIIASAFPATLELAAFSIAIGFGLGILLGILAAVDRGGFWDFFGNVWTGWNIGVPSFIAGLLYLLIFAVWLGWFPVAGRVPLTENPWEGLKHLILPSFALGGIVAAQISRFTRQSILDTLTEDYIRTARAKGLHERTVIFRHALKPSMIPVVTIMGLQLGSILGGTLVIEQVFTWPGVGRALVTAVRDRDYVMMQAITLLLVLIFLTVNLLVDLVYVA
ncbi:MAG: ABC transporter permease, partial [Chloroflexi bacterium]|nr:ABC transporter permease [Chloroflexota bacterium]